MKRWRTGENGSMCSARPATAATGGQGVIVQRGFPAPPSLHLPRLRQAGDRHFYQVIRDGYGAMYAYASRVPEDQRWAIIAYIRSLQLSRNARLDDVPRDRRPLPDTGEASP